MKLYHGTNDTALPSMLREGLLCKATSNHAGNWSHSVQSAANRVYMTDVYAPYFAFHAASKRDGDKAVLFEIDSDKLDQEQLLPDEDFLEQATRNVSVRGLRKGAGMRARTTWFRDNATRWRSLWNDSLSHLGTCAHLGNIPTHAITRYAVVDPKVCIALWMEAADAMVVLANHRFCSGKYAALTRLIFDNDLNAEELCNAMHFGAFPQVPVNDMAPQDIKAGLVERAQQLINVRNKEGAVYVHGC